MSRARVCRIREDAPDPLILREAGEVIRAGGLVAFPTETVYGLGGNALDPRAAAAIYEAKGRPSDNPLIVHIAKREELADLAKEIPEGALKLTERFWPGPLTIILPKKDIVPEGTTGGLPTVAVRLPDHPVATALIREAGVPIAAPSANTSGRPSPTEAAHVQEDLGDRIDMILDSGPVRIGLESTIVDFTGPFPIVLRPGYIGMKALEEILGNVECDPSLLIAGESTERPKAPGMRYRHYAPQGELVIVEGKPEKVIACIREKIREHMDRGEKAGVICAEEHVGEYTEGMVRSIGSLRDEESIAKHLYGTLRDFDKEEIRFLYSESFDTPDMGWAIMNRLRKAAGGNTIQVN